MQFGFVRFITVVSRMYLRGRNPETYVYTKNVSKNDDDNGDGKNCALFYFNCVLRDYEVGEIFYSLHK
jgi:hypothetical protein